MLGRPFQDKRHSMTGERPAQYAEISQVEDRFVFSVESMEVRRIMIPPEHLNHDTIEDADRRHRLRGRGYRIAQCGAILHRLRG